VNYLSFIIRIGLEERMNVGAKLSLIWIFGLSAFAPRSIAAASEIMPGAPALAREAPPRINGPTIFGVRPGSPFLYTIPATGERPMTFAVDALPNGLVFDSATGRITGTLKEPGRHDVILRATNRHGAADKKFRIVVGDAIALTPVMGWNSWNCWARTVDQEKVLRSARALVASGLAHHGWTYINLDDTWQGQRAGPDHALQSNAKFPDMHGLCDEIHRLGLKAGIYSTPWITSYAKFPGGSSDDASGTWSPELANDREHRHGKFSFAAADAQQWAGWGFDYLKYDWHPNDVEHVAEMSTALRASGRDIVFSLSNSAPFDQAADWARWANSWRTTNDIRDRWSISDPFWQYGVSEIGFSQDRWAPYAGPGHWNDPDMLVVGYVGWGATLHPTNLTPDEQYAHFSLWCMLSAPLLLGCDLERLDPFTLELLSNDEVIAIDQDALGRQATRVATIGPVDIYLKELEDGAKVIGFFNRDSTAQTVAFSKLNFVGVKTAQHVRDLWRHANLPDLREPTKQPLQATIPAHGVVLYRLSAAE
jgi:alpha-galactosidase